MKHSYKFLTKCLPFILGGALLTTVIGCLAFLLGYNSKTSWLNLSGAFSILYIIALLATLGFAVYTSIKTDNIHITRIKKNSGFLKAAASLACIITMFSFCFDFIKIIIGSYGGYEPFEPSRIARFIFTLPLSVYFLLMVLPSKFKRKKIKVPKAITYICSVSTILWCVISILAIYFYKGLATMNITKIMHLLVYLSFAVFFLFEVKFELIKPSTKGYLISGFTAFILSAGFTLTVWLSRIMGIIPKGKAFSDTELILTILIGFYALARMYAIPKTMKHVLENSDNSSFSSKFSRHSHKRNDGSELEQAN